jgi:hypothetical protein
VHRWHIVAELAEIPGSCADDCPAAIHAGVPPGSSSPVGTSSRARTGLDGEVAAHLQRLVIYADRPSVRPESCARGSSDNERGDWAGWTPSVARAFQSSDGEEVQRVESYAVAAAVSEPDHPNGNAARCARPSFGGVP